MKRLGRVLHISSNKNIIIKVKNTPRIGDNVVDKSLNPIGTVFDVFGPSTSPYVAVKTRLSESNHLIGQFLYTFTLQNSNKKGRSRKNE